MMVLCVVELLYFILTTSKFNSSITTKERHNYFNEFFNFFILITIRLSIISSSAINYNYLQFY